MILVIFFATGNNEKKNLIMMKNEKKKICAEKIELGYCPDYIVRIVLQGSNCIAT